MTDDTSRPIALEPTAPEPLWHDDSGAVRFWVLTPGGATVGSSIPWQVLHHRFKAAIGGVDALNRFMAHRSVIEAVAQRRIAQGSIEPVMLREHDFA